MPGHIRNLSDGVLDNVKHLLDSPLCTEHELQPYAMIMVANRLAAPWQLIRLAVKAAESDDAARIANSPYAPAVSITLGDIERMVDELKADLKRGATVAVTSLLKCIHDAVRGVRTELDLSGGFHLGAPARRDPQRDLDFAEGRDRIGARPRAAPDAAAAAAARSRAVPC